MTVENIFHLHQSKASGIKQLLQFQLCETKPPGACLQGSAHLEYCRSAAGTGTEGWGFPMSGCTPLPKAKNPGSAFYTEFGLFLLSKGSLQMLELFRFV